MRYARPSQGPAYLKCAGLIATIFFVGSVCRAQNAQPTPAPDAAELQDLSKNPALVAEFGKLAGRLEREVVLPEPRKASGLLPLLPESTTFYIALPNYGEAAHQSLGIFQQELQASAALREWWQKAEPASRGPKLEDSIEKFYQVSQYMGDEVVVSGTTGGREPRLLIVAQIRKPGLKEALQAVVRELPPSFSVRVLDGQELAAAGNAASTQQLLVLVRPDFVVACTNLAVLRNFSAHLDSGERNFASTPFGQRVAQAYEGGATMVGAADLRTILSQVPRGTPQGQLAFQRSGFTDMKYAVWARRRAGGATFSNGELSFTGPRHGIASWLAAPGPMGSLDFASPNAIVVSSMLLKSPAEMFEDVRGIASASNPNAFASLGAFEQMFGISLKDDLLGQLDGEITLELDGITPKPAWKVILGVKDGVRLQRTLSKLFGAMHVVTGQVEEGGITYYEVNVPASTMTTEISYAFVPGYLIVAPGHDAIADAVRLDESGESLGKSAKLAASLPPGHPSGASALMYEDPVAMAGLQLRQIPPEMASSLLRLTGEGKPMVGCAYGEETAIRAASTNPGMDAGAVAVVAAIAIPNLLRSRMAANESSAVATMRSVVTAEVSYAATYPFRGYAPDLATLGPNPNGPSHTADHAALLDASVADPSCTAGAWCTKAGFRFSVTGSCRGRQCSEFIAVATPVADDAGTRSFCATSDGVIHFKTGAPLTSPVGASECRTWPAIR
jgi:type IV pilus assembly protein PilA